MSNVELLEESEAGVLEAPNPPQDENEGTLEKSKQVSVLSNAKLAEPTEVGIAEVEVAPNAGVFVAPTGMEEPNKLLPSAGCDG